MTSSPPANAAVLRRDLTRYFLLAFGITWALLCSIMVLGLPEFPTVLPAIYGPTLAAVILTSVSYGRAGLKRFLSRFLILRVAWYWYAFLIFGFAAIGFLGVVFWSWGNGSPINLPVHSFDVLGPVLIFQVLVPGLGEEFGWRGFALQRLQQLVSPLKASLMLGCIHWLWHLPTFWLGQGMHNVPALWSFLYVLPLTILFTWAYNHTRGSVLISVLFHGLHGVVLTAVAFLPPPDRVPITPDLLVAVTLPDGLLGPYVIVTLLYWIMALAVAAGAFGGLGTPPAYEHVDES